MSFVIAELCVGTKDGGCVEVCPVECIHSDENSPQFYINPAECIDCGLCESACPVSAIYQEDELPPKWRNFIEVNARYFADA